MVVWKHLIQFITDDGSIHVGDAIITKAEADIGKLADNGSLHAHAIDASGSSDIFSANAKLTDEVLHVKQLLAPLTQKQVPIIRCIGLNYMKHSKLKKPSIRLFKTVLILDYVAGGSAFPSTRSYVECL